MIVPGASVDARVLDNTVSARERVAVRIRPRKDAAGAQEGLRYPRLVDRARAASHITAIAEGHEDDAANVG